jgi:hypothetical protein
VASVHGRLRRKEAPVRRTSVLVVTPLLVLFLAFGCGTVAGPVTVELTPATPLLLPPGASQTFTATVAGTPNGAVTWAATCGRIDVDAAGVATYVAPGEAVTCTVTATSVADPSASAVAVVTIAEPDLDDIRWLRQYGTAGGYVMPADIAVDAAGYVLVAGYATGELNGVASGPSDAFLIQYDADGTERWIRRFGSDQTDWASAVAVGPDGQAFVTGYTAGDLGGAGSGSAYVIRFDRDGDESWRRQFGAARSDDEFSYGVGVVADRDGNVYVTWSADAVADDPVDLALVSKFDASGTELWRRPFAEGFPFAAMAIDAEGRVLVTGQAPGGIVIVTFDPAGDEVGRRAIQVQDVVMSVRLLSDGRAFLTGTATPVGGGAAFDAFVAAYASDGALAWRRQLGTPNADYGRAVAVADDGRVLMAGASAILDGFDDERIDVFLVLLGPSGDELWRRRYGGDEGGRDWASGAVFGPDGDPVVIGGAHGTLRRLSAEPAQVEPPFDERVDTELFVMKLTP